MKEENCKHPELKFLGIQRDAEGKPILSLYNCLNCNSTISSGIPNKISDETKICALKDPIYKGRRFVTPAECYKCKGNNFKCENYFPAP